MYVKVLFKYSKSFTLHREQSPKLQHIAPFLFLSHLSANLLTIKTMKNLAGTVKNISLDSWFT